MKISAGLIRSALVVVLVSGCASAGGLRQEPLDRGIARQFSAPMSSVVGWARESLVDAGFSIEEASQPTENSWLIIGQKDASVWSWGELVRVVLIEESADATTVRVITQRKMATSVTADGDHSESIFSGIALRLAAAGGN
jgi:hypothetical protein